MASKVLLVEDDNNLREIYQARLQAEGYDIVSAKDGEEALVIAKKEQPDLIISDVMMPRVSGFEMLDILRNTEGLKDPKVIMLTALGQSDDQARAEQLGADRYLVKSQVTLEDIVKAAQDLLTGGPVDAAAPSTPAAVSDNTTTAPVAPVPTPITPPAPAAPAPVAPVSIPSPIPAPAAPTPVPQPEPPVPPPAVPVPLPTPPEPLSTPTPPPVPEPVAVPEPPKAPDSNPINDRLMADALKDLTSATADPVLEPSTIAPTVTPPPAVPVPLPTPPEPLSTPTPPPVPEPVAVPEPIPAPAPDPVIPVTPPATDTPTATPDPEPATTTSNDPAGGDSVPVAHKKIIRPLGGATTTPAPNLDELLAKEGIGTEPVPAAAPATPVPAVQADRAAPEHPPGHVISPTAPTAAVPEAAAQIAPAPSDEEDPNNIAL